MQLNDKQKEAVEALDGPVLVLAGAGAGKTRVLVERILNLIKSKKAEAHEILAITFTNKAAKEMRERVLARIDSDDELNRPINALYSGLGVPFISTFHSLGVHIMREQARFLGIKKHFSILDRQDSGRLIKQAIKQMGLDPKEEDPKGILNAISRAKSDALSPELFLAEANSFKKEQTAHIWRLYEDAKKKEGAFDFDDLLLVPLRLLQENDEVLRHYQNLWKYILVDEYQDTNKVQFEILRLLAGAHGNIFVVGDVDQCLTGDTQVKISKNKSKKISQIKAGDKVLSAVAPDKMGLRVIKRVLKKKSKEQLVKVELANGKSIVSSKRHVFFAQFENEFLPDMHFVYLMYKEGFGFRLGISKTYKADGKRKKVLGFAQRARQEHAGKTWVIETCGSESEARIRELELSLKYKIPTIVFMARTLKDRKIQGPSAEQKLINEFYKNFDSEEGAKKLMRDYGLYFDYPHYLLQSANGKRLNLNIVLNGEPRANRSLHRISLLTYDPDAVKSLKEAGFKIRPAKRGSKSYRYESAFANMEDIIERIDKIKSAVPSINVNFKIRLKKSKYKNHKTSVPFMPASSLRPGMLLYTDSFKPVLIKKITFLDKDLTLYDLDIESSHNFVANGIIVHNSIYSWRGANYENMLFFKEHFPGAKEIFLEQNYRSTKTIIEAANAVIEKNEKRPEKVLFTEGPQGEHISFLTEFDAKREAFAVAKKAKELIECGVPADEIAVLYRMNFISRVLEEAFLAEGVPYQMLGTRFFERKEVKDLLSFLKLSLNRDSLVDLHRAAGAVPRGLGKQTLLKIQEKKISELGAAAQAKVQSFFKMLDEIQDFAGKNKVSDTLKFVLEKSGMKTLLEGKGDDGQERLLNLFELIELSKKYDDLEPSEALLKFLEEAALAQDQDELEKEAQGVKLMTVHASKGLEFKVVFIVAAEQGIFPVEKLSEDDDEEEERRLFYVAITRAEEKLFISRAFERQVYGELRMQEPSEFLSDIPSELVQDESEFDETAESPFKNRGHDRGVDLIEW